MADYRVNLDIFAGPLDLLLYLVRKEEVDIYDIPIAKITDQYLRYVEMLKSLDMDVAGAFLVMAATLMHIKSAMLLPKTEADQTDNENYIDPRSELIRQLLEYKKFKDAANFLESAADEAQLRFNRPDSVIRSLQGDAEPEVDLDRVNIWDLLEAFDAICKATGAGYQLDHITDETPIDLYQIELLTRLQTEGPLLFTQIFESKLNRLVMVGLFLGLLELIRDGLAGIEAAGEGAYKVRALTNEQPALVVQRAIAATIQSSETNQQAERPQQAGADKSHPALEDQPKTEEQHQVPPIPIVQVPAEKRNHSLDEIPLAGDAAGGRPN